jgi:tRNA (guanine37-N1)-methyltransferase
VVPYDVEIGYDFWSYFDVMKSILPEELHEEIPSGFNTVGHVGMFLSSCLTDSAYANKTAHLNIRDQYLPYKNIIAQVLLDKNPHIKTVINKIDNVGSENEFRTFAYEVLGGPDDLNVEVSEAGCIFKFDYSKVYWNSKLDTEHKRIAGLFKPGEVVADVMAGIGPFAVPAGKKGVFVWANDKNPESYRYLEDAVRRNKVSRAIPFSFRPNPMLTLHGRSRSLSSLSITTATTLSEHLQTSFLKHPSAVTVRLLNPPDHQESPQRRLRNPSECLCHQPSHTLS